MEIIIQPTAPACDSIAAGLLAALIRKKPTAVLGLSTGSTPLGLYGELIRMHREEGLDFSRVTTFNLDEYVGLAAEHPASYRRFMQDNLFCHLNVAEQNIHIPDGTARDIPAECGAYESAIQSAGGIDMQILGIGADGHIGFNEPSSSLVSRTRLKTLTRETMTANQRFFSQGEQVPRHVITMGVGTIMDSRCCLLLAFGEKKSQAVAGMAEGPVTAMCPASILQMHPRAILLADDPAASTLTRRDYYRYVYENRPDFQRICDAPTNGIRG